MNKSAINNGIKKSYVRMNSMNEKMQNTANKRLVGLYKKSLADIRLELDRLYAKFGTSEPSLGQAARMGQLRNMEKQITNILLELHDDSATIIQDTMESLYTKNYNILQKTLNAEIGIDIPLGVINEASVKQSLETPLKYLTRTTNVTNNKIREAITRNLINGEAYPKLSADIAQIMGEGAGSAMRIARTEEHRVIAEARAESFKEIQETGESIGIKLEKEWFATNDSRGRHQFMDGQISVNGKFNFKGQMVEEPGMTGDAGEDINCRCTTGVVIV